MERLRAKTRKKTRKQIPLMVALGNHAHAEGLDGISRFLDRNPITSKITLQDLTHNIKNPETGAEEMTAGQAIRAMIVSQRQACPDITRSGLKISKYQIHCNWMSGIRCDRQF